MSVKVTGIEASMRALEDHVDDMLRVAAQNMWDGITSKTPVDTGRLRSAWNPSMPVRSFGIGKVLTIRNSLPYAPVVEYGRYPGVGPKTVAANDGIYSRQAPRGMMRITVEEVATWLESQNFNVKRI